MPKLSVRAGEVPASPIRKLTPLAEEAVRRGLKVFHLNIGQPDVPSPQVGLDALRHIDRTVLEYSPSEGFYGLRKGWADYYRSFGVAIEAGDVVVTTGASEAVLFGLLSCLNPGDEVIAPEPLYANYIAFTTAAGVTLRPVAMTIETGFCMPGVAAFEALVNERTKAILLCNPNNPTANVYTRQELEAIGDLARRYDLYLFADEVYREFNYSGTPFVSALHLQGLEEQVVVFDSFSKRYSECGIRIGAIITRNAALRAAVLKLCQARLSPPLLGQIVAEASWAAPADYRQSVYEEYKARRDCLLDGLSRIPGVVCPVPQGAFYAMVELPVDDAERFCAWCLSDFSYEGQTVMLAPGAGFYVTPGLGQRQVRMAYVLQKNELERALLVLSKALAAYPGRRN